MTATQTAAVPCAISRPQVPAIGDLPSAAAAAEGTLGDTATAPATPAATFVRADLPTVRPAAPVSRRGCGAAAADFLQHLASRAPLRRMSLHSANGYRKSSSRITYHYLDEATSDAKKIAIIAISI